VDRVVVREGRAVAARTRGGEEIAARRAILADVTAPALYLRLPPTGLPTPRSRIIIRKPSYRRSMSSVFDIFHPAADVSIYRNIFSYRVTETIRPIDISTSTVALPGTGRRGPSRRGSTPSAGASSLTPSSIEVSRFVKVQGCRRSRMALSSSEIGKSARVRSGTRFHRCWPSALAVRSSKHFAVANRTIVAERLDRAS